MRRRAVGEIASARPASGKGCCFPWLALLAVALVLGACGPDAETNEAAAVATLRTLNTSLITYRTTNNGFYGTLDDLMEAGFLGEEFGEGATVAGYVYTTTLTAGDADYRVDARPVSLSTGRYAYYSGPDQIVRYASGPGVREGDVVDDNPVP
jgi:hypothetical protein